MPTKRLVTIMLASASLIISGAVAAPQGKGPPQDRGGQQQENKGQQQAAKHKHVHQNGHNALGAKLKQNGKHEVGKLGNRTVTADVENGKVKNMAAGDLPMKRVKTTMKMASVDVRALPVVAAAGVIPAQFAVIDYYYGYCFDDGYDLTCYWYEPEEVYYSDYDWDDYDPYY